MRRKFRSETTFFIAHERVSKKKQILTLSIDMEDKPGQLNEISKLCEIEKINILAVEHSRFTFGPFYNSRKIEYNTRNSKQKTC